MSLINLLDKKIEKYQKYAPLVLRLGVSLVFLWFGLNQIFDSSYFLGYLPDFAFNLGIEPTTLVILNGILETTLGLLLLIGFKTRIVALLLALHLAGITLTVGFNEIGIRDFGLTLATASIFLSGPDQWCRDLSKK